MVTGFLQRYAAVFVWMAFIAALTYTFSWLLDKQANPNQSNITAITSTGEVEVVLKRNRQGHYVANGKINNQSVRFFLDTGATDVSIPESVANRINLKKGVSMLARTANGTVEVFATRLDRVTLGGIELGNVSASINPGMQGRDALLGMSFLSHLEMIQRGDTLTLRIP